ncbi:MAG: ribokinase [Roseibium sp.]|nr:ribokinase [Roseibium sp.]
MKSVTVVGSINIDLTSYLDRWPEIGETVAVRETARALGGKGANQAVAATRLGADVTLVGALGQDAFGQEADGLLREEGIQLELTHLSGCATGLAFIDVGPDGGNLIRLAGGANAKLSPAQVALHADAIGQSDVVLLQNEIDLAASLEAARLARKAGALVIMDPAPSPQPGWSRATFSSFDILTPNAAEAGKIVGWQPASLSEARDAVCELRSYGLRGAIVTMGDIGVAWSFEGASGTLVAEEVQTIDTVAAGDCFNGALATRLAFGESIEDAIFFATRAAALATTRKGASEALPTLSEVETFRALATA